MSRISEIKVRFKKRTKGEWRCIELGFNENTYKIETKNHIIIAIAYSKPNATFIKYAPEDIGFLIAEHRRFEKENRKLKMDFCAINEIAKRKITKLQRVCKCAEAENKALMAYFADKNETTKTMTDLVETYNQLMEALSKLKTT